MPKRTIQHQLEDLSRSKFELLLPKHWVCRDKGKDYGIDCEVEIFDINGETTGLVFWVQLKATQSKKDGVIESASLRLETIAYYQRLDIPVLVVRYSSQKDIFYTRWASGIDPFYAKLGAKSMSVQFEAHDLWTTNTSANIERYLKKLRFVKSGLLSLPLDMTISYEAQLLSGKVLSVLKPKLRAELNKYSELVRLDPDQDKTCLHVAVAPKALSVSVLGTFGVTFHGLDEYSSENMVSDLVQDIILGIATAVSGFGYKELSASIIFARGISSRLKLFPELLCRQLPVLIRTEFFEETLSLVNEAADTQGDNFVENLASIAVLSTRSKCTEKQYAAIEEFLIRNVERSKSRSLELTGVAQYNLGNFYRARNCPNLAIQNYLSARKNDRSYYSQDYFFGELAGVLFGMGKFTFASIFYRKAVELDGEKDWRPLYADALLFAGRYSEALSMFKAYLSNTKKPSAEWRLKASCLKSVISTYKIGSQDRNQELALGLADHGKPDGADAEDDLRKALNTDLLCGLAWFNLAQLRLRSSDLDDAAICFLVCALLQPSDLEAWVNATLLGFNKSLPVEMFALTICAAYDVNGDHYLEALYENIESQDRPGLLEAFSPVIEGLIQVSPRIEPEPEVRMADGKGRNINVFGRKWRDSIQSEN